MAKRTGVVAGALAVAAGLAGGAQAADQTVTATSADTFVSSDVTVNVGDTVTWTNSGGNHNVKFDDGSFESPADVQPPGGAGWPVTRTFTGVGEFRYYCELHGGPGGAGMAGIVRVVAAPPGPGQPGPAPQQPGTPNPPPGGPGSQPLTPLKVSFAVSDATPARGSRVRLTGFVRPARDGRRVQIQRRGRGGAFRTIATARLLDAGAAKSRFGVRLKIRADAVLRVRVAGDSERGAGVSATRRLDVRRPRR